MHDGRRIHGNTVTQSRFETHFVRGIDGCFVKAVSHATNDTVDMQLAVCPEHDFQRDIALQLQLASFVGVHGSWFVGDLNRGGRRSVIHLVLLQPAARLGDCLRSEAGGLHATAIAATIAAAVPVHLGRCRCRIRRWQSCP